MFDVSKLTDEQVEKAAQVAFDSDNTVSRWIGAEKATKSFWRNAIRAAAPYLQLPIEPPTEQEIHDATSNFENSKRVGTPNSRAMGLALGWVMAHRNAANFPKPDPRKEKLGKLLRAYKTTFDYDLEKLMDVVIDIVEGKR